VSGRGFRNLAPLELALPPAGGLFVGPNGHGKTNLLEVLTYPVLFRSMRGARDLDLVAFGAPAFHLALDVAPNGAPRTIEAGFDRETRRKRIRVDGVEQRRAVDAVGILLAVSFLPGDVALVAGSASERRAFVDRVLSLSDRAYLQAARAYRATLDQRNAALRQGRPSVAALFDEPLARAGAALIAARIAWIEATASRWGERCAELGEPMEVRMRYRGREELARADEWPRALAEASPRDVASGSTTVGPHRDDILLRLGQAPLRDVGSTGQQRTAAIALKLCELDTLGDRTGQEPALVLDDVFAELDRERQERLARALRRGRTRQVFVTTPRADELPDGLDLPAFSVRDGTVREGAG
jgi:DNA replication and repair protein RecF